MNVESTPARPFSRMPHSTWGPLALVIMLGACFGPDYPEGLRCSEAQTCPPGQTCDLVQDVCLREPSGPVAPGDPDADTGAAGDAAVTYVDAGVSEPDPPEPEPDADPGSECIDDNDCGQGRICVDGRCVDRPRCGDGVPNGDDECDDGNLVDGDGCDAQCRFEEVVYSYTGEAEFYRVPAGATEISIEVLGAEGGQSTVQRCVEGPAWDRGGLGGRAFGLLRVKSGDVLEVRVGGAGEPGEAGGFNGGGPGCPPTRFCSGGGGASDVRHGDSDLERRIIVAGGGGGAEYSGCDSGGGGAGGGLVGGDSAGNDLVEAGGTGGSQTAGGRGGAGLEDDSTYDGSNGTRGQGGASTILAHGGGGGGGWFGGGGGGYNGHGGGGSSYLDPILSDAATEPGVREGHGQITITVTAIAPPALPSRR